MVERKIMENKKTFINNTIALYAMNIVKLIFPFLTLPYLTRVLSTSGYGVVTYVKAVIVYAQLFIDFGFMLSATKKIVCSDGDKNKIGIITGDTIIEKILLSVIATFIYVILMFIIPIMKANVLFCSLYLLSVLVQIFIFDFLFRGIEKMHLISIPYVVSKSLTTGLTFFLVKSDNDLNAIVALEVIGNFLAAIISCYFVKNIGIKIRFSNAKNLLIDLKESSVYFLSNFATTIFGALTTVVAGLYLNITYVAYWGICMQLLSAAKSLYNPITNSIYPHMIKNKDLKLVKKVNLFMSIPIVIGSIIILFGGDIIMEIIGGPQYRSAGVILKFLLPAFICSFYSMMYGWPVLGSINKAKETTFTTVISAIVQFVCLIVMIISNNFTIILLAISCSISEIALLLTRYRLFLKYKSLFTGDLK